MIRFGGLCWRGWGRDEVDDLKMSDGGEFWRNEVTAILGFGVDISTQLETTLITFFRCLEFSVNGNSSAHELITLILFEFSHSLRFLKENLNFHAQFSFTFEYKENIIYI